jgi:hypothetical protein
VARKRGEGSSRGADKVIDRRAGAGDDVNLCTENIFTFHVEPKRKHYGIIKTAFMLESIGISSGDRND